MRPAPVRPIDRQRRGTHAYELKVNALEAEQRQVLELAEEAILADLGRSHARRALVDGTTFDLTAYAEFGVLLSFRQDADGNLLFLDFAMFGSA